jgi:hypothetical protein
MSDWKTLIEWGGGNRHFRIQTQDGQYRLEQLLADNRVDAEEWDWRGLGASSKAHEAPETTLWGLINHVDGLTDEIRKLREIVDLLALGSQFRDHTTT